MRPTVAGHSGRVWVMHAMGLGHAEVLGHVVWASPRRPGKWGHVDVLKASWGGCRSAWLDVTGRGGGQWMKDVHGVAGDVRPRLSCPWGHVEHAPDGEGWCRSKAAQRRRCRVAGQCPASVRR